MFGAELRYLNASVAGIHYILPDTLHLVAEDDGIASAAVQMEVLQLSAVLHLFYGIDAVVILMQRCHGVHRVLKVCPWHTLFGAQCRLMYLGAGRTGADAAEHDSFYAESVARTEHAAHIVEAADVVEHHRYWQFVRLLILLYREAVHLDGTNLSHQ